MDDKTMLDRLRKSLRLYGYDVPIEEDEIQNIDNASKGNPDMPQDLQDPKKIIQKGIVQNVELKSISNQNDKAAKNLAMAAREGKRITDEVMKEMEKDRNIAENNDQK